MLHEGNVMGQQTCVALSFQYVFFPPSLWEELVSDTIVPFDLADHVSDKLLQEGIRHSAYVTAHFQQP